MKLNVFTPEQVGQVQKGNNTIRFNRKAGLVSLSKQATLLLQLEHADKVIFAQDEKEKADWYVAKVTDQKGFEIRIKDDSANLNNCGMVHRILDSLDIPAAVGYTIAKEPTELGGVKYFALITSNPINKK